MDGFKVPRNRYWGLHPPPAPLEDVVDEGLMAIQRAIFLRKAGVETPVDDDFLSNPPSRADLLETAIKSIIRCVHFFCLFVYLVLFRIIDLTFPFSSLRGWIRETGLSSFQF